MYENYWQLWDDSGLLKVAHRDVIRRLWAAELALDPGLWREIYAENAESGEIVENLDEF